MRGRKEKMPTIRSSAPWPSATRFRLLQATQFVKLSRDCQFVGSTLSEADPPLMDADVQVVYTAEVSGAILFLRKVAACVCD